MKRSHGGSRRFGSPRCSRSRYHRGASGSANVVDAEIVPAVGAAAPAARSPPPAVGAAAPDAAEIVPAVGAAAPADAAAAAAAAPWTGRRFVYTSVRGKEVWVDTTVTSDVNVVRQFVLELRGELTTNSVVGFDTEWFDLNGNQPHERKVYRTAVIQVCFRCWCLVFQVHRAGGVVPDKLKQFLECHDYILAGSLIGNDATRMREDFGINLVRKVDLQDLHVNKTRKGMGLKRLAEMVGMDLPKEKELSRSEWNAPILSSKQINYASLDAFASYEVARFLGVGKP
ncbi:hypothetical protein ACP70R_040079 [Stipagrostis hirtigluma subsp. patula]